MVYTSIKLGGFFFDHFLFMNSGAPSSGGGMGGGPGGGANPTPNSNNTLNSGPVQQDKGERYKFSHILSEIQPAPTVPVGANIQPHYLEQVGPNIKFFPFASEFNHLEPIKGKIIHKFLNNGGSCLHVETFEVTREHMLRQLLRGPLSQCEI